MEYVCGVEAMMKATVIQQRKLEHMRLYIKAREGARSTKIVPGRH
jgi:hypothetical protein